MTVFSLTLFDPFAGVLRFMSKGAAATATKPWVSSDIIEVHRQDNKLSVIRFTSGAVDGEVLFTSEMSV